MLLLCLAGCNPKDMNSVTAQASGQETQEQENQEKPSGSLNLHYLDCLLFTSLTLYGNKPIS